MKARIKIAIASVILIAGVTGTALALNNNPAPSKVSAAQTADTSTDSPTVTLTPTGTAQASQPANQDTVPSTEESPATDQADQQPAQQEDAAPPTIVSRYYCNVINSPTSSTPYEADTYSDGSIKVYSMVNFGAHYDNCPNNTAPQSQ